MGGVGSKGGRGRAQETTAGEGGKGSGEAGGTAGRSATGSKCACLSRGAAEEGAACSRAPAC